MTTILGIETSCDETAAAVIIAPDSGPDAGSVKVLSNVIASQIDMHRQYGGVFPEVAARLHIEAIRPVVAQAMAEAQIEPQALDAVCVTRGPGLAGSLLVGVNFAKALALGWHKPLLGIHHIEGHIYSLWCAPETTPSRFPALILIVSGGHSELVLMHGHGQYEILGATLDDAVGEAFDKVARILGLPYPGGPQIERAARDGNPTAYAFPRTALEHSYNFSFSGIKTSVMRAIQQPIQGKRTRGVEAMDAARMRADLNVPDVAASFQAAVVDMLVSKTVQAAQQYGVTEILMAGGVSANGALRTALAQRAGVPVKCPALRLCTDNAAMIATAGLFAYRAGQRDTQRLDVTPMLPLPTYSKNEVLR